MSAKASKQANIWGSYNQKKKEIENSFEVKTVGSFAKLEPRSQHFCVVLAGHVEFTGTSIDTTFRPRFQSSSVSAHFRGIVALKASQLFVEKFFD